MTATIRLPANGPAWLPDYNRNVERAIGDADDALALRISAIEGELMALADAAEAMVTALASIEQMTVTVAAAAQVQTNLLAKIEALSRGRNDPFPGEEGDALLNELLSKETR